MSEIPLLEGSQIRIRSLVHWNYTHRSEAAALREQQDREYAESIERDRQMRESAERERLRREEEERERESEETRREQERELQNAIELSNILRREQEISEIRHRLPPEPTDSAPSEDIASVRFQLPKGGKLSRKFHRRDTIQVNSIANEWR